MRLRRPAADSPLRPRLSPRRLRPVCAPALLAGLALAAATCGGESEEATGPDPEPNRAPTAVIEAPASDTTVSGGDEVTFEGSASDPEDGALTGDALVWTSDEDGELGTGETITTTLSGGTSHTVTLTATDSEGSTATAGLGLSVLGSFRPGSDTELSGEHEFTDVEIPEGVRVSVTGDLTLRATGAVTVGGEVVGDCVAAEVLADSTLAVTGAVNTACGELPDGEAPGLKLVGEGGFELDGAEVRASGDIVVATDPETSLDTAGAGLTSDAGPAGLGSPSASRPPAPRSRVPGLAMAEEDTVAEKCSIAASTIEVDPRRAKKGEDGVEEGEDGEDGVSVLFECRERLTFRGGNVVRAQDGGHGGDAVNERADAGRGSDPIFDNDAEGGLGGLGGDIVFPGDAEIGFVGDNELQTGEGGDAGDAKAVARSDAPRSRPAFGAIANNFGGTTGTGGDIRVDDLNESGNFTTLRVGPGTLRIRLGSGGESGNAEARGADGKDATDQNPAQAGGIAHARARRGAHRGGLSRIVLEPAGGELEIAFDGVGNSDGGSATARGGDGGDGSVEFPDGAAGGDVFAEGGNGGLKPTLDQIAEEGPPPGVGGDANFLGGNGGDGEDRCNPPEPGGKGGPGGTFTGEPGEGGTDNRTGENGEPGEVFVQAAGNGGDAGEGDGPGAKGSAGSDKIGDFGKRTEIPRNFQPGAPAGPCGRQIGAVFNDGDGSSNDGVIALDADGDNLREFGPAPCDGEISDLESVGGFAWAYEEGPSCDGNPQVAVSNVNDGTKEVITSGAGAEEPAVTIDNRLLYGCAAESGAENLCSIEPDGTDDVQLSDFDVDFEISVGASVPSGQTSDLVGPDGLGGAANAGGDRLAVLAGRREGENFDLYLVAYDTNTLPTPGEDLVNLTDTPEGELDPQPSPDGERLAFGRVLEEESSRITVWLMDLPSVGTVRTYGMAGATAGEEIQIAPGLGYAQSPDWCPDGEGLVFIGEGTSGNPDLFRANADGTGVENLTRTPNRGEFEPDCAGEFVAYVTAFTDAEGNTAAELFRLDFGAGEPTQLTDLNGVVRYPAVEPQ